MGNMISFKKEFGLIIVGAIIFTASFLWKDLLSDIEELYFPKKYGIGGRLFFTVLVTVIMVMIAVHLRNFLGLNQQQNQPIRFDDDPLNNADRLDIEFDNGSQ